MSLREQLLKAGLVSETKVKEAASQARKQSHKAKKDKRVAAAEAAQKAEAERQRQAEIERQRERDRRLNRERELQKKRNEEAARLRQLINSQRLNDAAADICYNFLTQDKKTIRYLRVTEQQQRLLALGRIGVIANLEDEYDFPLLPRDTVLKLAESQPETVLLLHSYAEQLAPDDR